MWHLNLTGIVQHHLDLRFGDREMKISGFFLGTP